MAKCDIQALTDAASCLECLIPGQRELVKLSLLCNIWKALNVSAKCDPQSLLDAAACFMCLTPGQVPIIQTQLLCELLVATQSGGGQSCVFGGAGPPVNVPSCNFAVYIDDTVPGQEGVWVWNPTIPGWSQVIGGP